MTWLIAVKDWFLKNPMVLHVCIAIIVTLFVQLLVAILYKFVFTKLQKRSRMWFKAFIKALRAPLYVTIWYLSIIYLLDQVFLHIKAASLESVLPKANSIGMVIIWVWFLLRYINNIERAILREPKYQGKLDRTTVDGLIKIIKIFLFIIAILSVLQTFGVPLAAIYTAAGGAGIGITLAAQDLLRNFFGGLMMYFDRPFSIGDWISSPDKQIEGTVEKIGWRTTRIRTFDKRPLYVPNATFLTVSVENPSRMLFRRIRTDVGVRYDDWRVIPKITQEIEDMLRSNEHIATDQTIWVNLVDFAASSLNFRIYAFTKTTDWLPFQAIQQQIFMNVLEIIDKNGAEVAFPTQTVHVPDGITVTEEEQLNEHPSTN